MNLYRKLTKYISTYYASMKNQNVFFQRVYGGQVTVPEVATFIRNLTYLTQHSQLVLRLAVASSKEKNDHHLADFFVKKIADEDGHHKWGEMDFESIKKKFKVPGAADQITDEMKHYVEDVQAMVKEDPYQLFVYILFAEYLTVIGGPDFLKAVDKACGVPPEYMSVIGNHAEIDRDHINDWAEEAKSLGMTDKDFDRCKKVLDRVMSNYDRFCSAIPAKKTLAA